MNHGHATISISGAEQLVTLVRDRLPASMERSSSHTWSHRHEQDAGELHVVLDLRYPTPIAAQEAVEQGLHTWTRFWDELEGHQPHLVVWTTRVQRTPGTVMGMGSGFQLHLDLQYQPTTVTTQ